jgi:hypothetical protein
VRTCFEESEAAARREHAVHLVEDRLLVGDVHADVHHHRDVERVVVQGQRLTRRRHERGPVGEADPGGQRRGGVDELRREVDARHLGTGHRGHP